MAAARERGRRWNHFIRHFVHDRHIISDAPKSFLITTRTIDRFKLISIIGWDSRCHSVQLESSYKCHYSSMYGTSFEVTP